MGPIADVFEFWQILSSMDKKLNLRLSLKLIPWWPESRPKLNLRLSLKLTPWWPESRPTK
eukprot:scaffold40230_cov12-Tisochrysis_lutea.AAC.1